MREWDGGYADLVFKVASVKEGDSKKPCPAAASALPQTVAHVTQIWATIRFIAAHALPQGAATGLTAKTECSAISITMANIASLPSHHD
ncbi:hypothetical protein [Comamonas resistens]|uniref:Uncharacterized protein n=1 Tax=Comamonas resistens TaxID=3046670 RepID=A0ABY8SL66_9BURK|nr:hypothetical protein [Comamonas resistens]MDL5034817.1 hypothetical protein [Comamonas resistens]WHS63450.1 hypothetical protein QMY55_12875 [Comamonas resistens]